MLRGSGEIVFRQVVLAQLEIRPAQGIQIGAIRRLQFDRFFDHSRGFVELDSTIGKHVAKIIEDGGIIGAARQYLAENLFCVIVFLLTLESCGAQE